MKIKASMVVMSHLSDAQELINNFDGYNRDATNVINFTKFVILQTNGDLNQEIDADQMWEKFKNR